jgi:two-component system cell cycle response regulator
MKVMVIEDHPTDLKLMGEVLKISGHSVHERTSAEGAQEAILADHPDLILIDLRLPGMDGLTLIRQLKANAGSRDIPLVAITAYPERYRREELLAAGCEACIVKPIDTRQLPKQLEEMAGRKSH